MSMLYLRNSFMAAAQPRKPRFFASEFRALFAVLAVLVIALAGCATAPTESVTPESMKARALVRSAERWKALTDKRFSEVYDYLSVGSKVGVTAPEYAEAMRRMGYIHAEVESAECDLEVCTVRSAVTLPIFIRNVGARPQSIPVTEKWVWSKGDLWLIRN